MHLSLLEKIQLWRMMIYRSWFIFSVESFSGKEIFIVNAAKMMSFWKTDECANPCNTVFFLSQNDRMRARCENGWWMSISNELKKGLLRVVVLRDIWCLWELATRKQKLQGKFVMWPMLNRCNYVLRILIYGAAGIAVYNIIYIYTYICIYSNKLW